MRRKNCKILEINCTIVVYVFGLPLKLHSGQGRGWGLNRFGEELFEGTIIGFAGAEDGDFIKFNYTADGVQA